jgi:hypothetical protein
MMRNKSRAWGIILIAAGIAIPDLSALSADIRPWEKYGLTDDDGLCSGKPIRDLYRQAYRTSGTEQQAILEEIERLLQRYEEECLSRNVASRSSAKRSHRSPRAEQPPDFDTVKEGHPTDLELSIFGNCPSQTFLLEDGKKVFYYKYNKDCGDLIKRELYYSIPRPIPDSSDDSKNFRMVCMPAENIPLPKDKHPIDISVDWSISEDSAPDIQLRIVILDDDGGVSVIAPSSRKKADYLPRNKENARRLHDFLSNCEVSDTSRTRSLFEKVRNSLLIAIAWDPNLRILNGDQPTDHGDDRFSVTYMMDGGSGDRFCIAIPSSWWYMPFGFYSYPLRSHDCNIHEPFSDIASRSPMAREYLKAVKTRGFLTENEKVLIDFIATENHYAQVLSIYPSIDPSQTMGSVSPLSCLGVSSGASVFEITGNAALNITHDAEFDFLIHSNSSCYVISGGEVRKTWFRPEFLSAGTNDALVDALGYISLKDTSLTVVLNPDSTNTVGLITAKTPRIFWGLKLDRNQKVHEIALIEEDRPMKWRYNSAWRFVESIERFVPPHIDEFLRNWILEKRHFVLLDHFPSTGFGATHPWFSIFGDPAPRPENSTRYPKHLCRIDQFYCFSPRKTHSLSFYLVGKGRPHQWVELGKAYQEWFAVYKEEFKQLSRGGELQMWIGKRSLGSSCTYGASQETSLSIKPRGATKPRRFECSLSQVIRLPAFEVTFDCFRGFIETPEIEAIMAGCCADDYSVFCWLADPYGLFDRVSPRRNQR